MHKILIEHGAGSMQHVACGMRHGLWGHIHAPLQLTCDLTGRVGGPGN